MARPGLKNRQYTIYARDDADIPRWRELCRPLTLNRWILEMIERGIEDRSKIRTTDTEELNSLRKKNLELKQESEILKMKLQEKEEIEKLQATTREENKSLRKDIVDILKSSGTLDSVQITEHILSKLREKNPNVRHPLKLKAIHLRSVKRILDELEDTGLIELTPKGWKWIK